MPRPHHEPHELDGLSFEQLTDIAEKHDLAGWVTQRQGFVELRDLANTTITAAERALSELRQSWTGNGAEAFTAEFAQIIDLLTGLRDSSASNADGMREMALIMRDTREEAELLRSENNDWADNPEGDSPETISSARDEIRKELRDRLKDADEAYQHLSGAYLLPPPEPPRLIGLESIAFEPAHPRPLNTPTSPASTTPHLSDPNTTTPSLQNSAHAQPAGTPPAEPVPAAAPPPAEPAPMMPMGGAGAAGDIGNGSTTGARTGSGGPTFAAPQNVPPSRMRSGASRQQLHNHIHLDETRPVDPAERRRAVHADDDSPFVPTESTVVPPVITGGTPFTGPHDSGPVIANTIPQRFPEYGHEEPLPDITTEYEDGSSVDVVFDALPDDAPPPPETTSESTSRDKAASNPSASTLDG